MTDTVDSLKQRLVGAFVIVTLAIIFLPMVFDKPHQQSSVVVVPVPPKPVYKTIEITKPVPPKFKEVEEDAETGKLVESNSHAVVEGEKTLKSGSTKKERATATVDKNTPSSKIVSQEKNIGNEPKASKSKNNKPTVKNLSIFKNVWMVQLGTFGNIKNAYNLRDKLRKDGFDGHTKVITLNGKKAVKVFSGPFVKKRDAIKTKKKLDKKYKVDSRVVFFDA